LPAEEQAAAAAAGKDELKQAAKRVRESKRKPAAEPADAAPEAASEAGAAEADSLESLRHRVATLAAENAALRDEVASLRARLRAIDSTADQAAEMSPPF
ncbi:MAG TPA: hypothetical protein VJ693_21145, partial [Ideonella sp.]|nr:hypothetical protein [Ideonella sp.]